MRRALVPVVALAGTALALAVVAGTIAANNGHSPTNVNGQRRGGPPVETAAPVATAPASGATVAPIADASGAAAATAGASQLAASPVLGASQAAILQGMAEEEKLAFDLYTALSGTWSRNVWSNIARSETTHLSEVRTLLAEYGVADPTAGMAAGTFATPAIQQLYDSLLASGRSGETAALTAGRTVELDDIAHLDAALADAGLPADVALVYSNLRSASFQHLASFERLLGL
jgi:hypothetical protein